MFDYLPFIVSVSAFQYRQAILIVRSPLFAACSYTVAAIMAAARRVCWADWSDAEDDVLGPWANFAAGRDGDAEAAATAAPTAKRKGKRKKRKGPQSSLPQATSQGRPYSPSRLEAEPLPVGQVRKFRQRAGNRPGCLQNQQMRSSGAGGPIIRDFKGAACASASGTGCGGASPVLQEEIYQFVCSVMHPESHVQWGQLAEWQRGLQVQATATGQQLPNPFWHAVLFDLDVALWPIVPLWQESLRGQTHKLWHPRRLWHQLIHDLDL